MTHNDKGFICRNCLIQSEFFGYGYGYFSPIPMIYSGGALSNQFCESLLMCVSILGNDKTVMTTAADRERGI